MGAPQASVVDLRAVRGEAGSPFIETSHVYGGYRFRCVGTGVFEFSSRSSSQRYLLDLAGDPPCSCWPATNRSAPLGICPHLRVLQAFLKKQKEKQI